jgi:predicted SAM-dependent methyltransferase
MRKRIKKSLKNWAPKLLLSYWNNIKRRNLVIDMKEGWNTYLKCNSEVKLQIGSGGNRMEGWFNTDIQLEVPGVYFLDAGEVFPMDSNSVDCIYSEHVFEHLTVHQQLNYLKEAFRVLKPSGKIRIATPDLTQILSLLTDKNQFNMDYINWNFDVFVKNKFSLSSNVESKTEYVINNYMRDWGHQMIHSKSSLKEMVNLSGFTQIGFFEVGQSNDSCLHNIERHFEMIGIENNIFETMILEASK